MIDFLSACIGALASLLLAMASYHYQQWKSDVQNRIALFYQSRQQILRNRNLIISSQTHPDKKEMLLNRVQFLPAYPFVNFDILDEGFRTASNTYDKALIRVLSGDTDFESFDSASSHTLNSVNGMIFLWTEYLKKQMILYFLLPFLLRRIHKKLTQKDPKP